MALATCRHLRTAPCRGPGRLKRRPSPLTCSPHSSLPVPPLKFRIGAHFLSPELPLRCRGRRARFLPRSAASTTLFPPTELSRESRDHRFHPRPLRPCTPLPGGRIRCRRPLPRRADHACLLRVSPSPFWPSPASPSSSPAADRRRPPRCRCHSTPGPYPGLTGLGPDGSGWWPA